MSDIINFPQSEPDELLSGPFEHYDVIVEGRSVPRLAGRKTKEGNIFLIVDGRYGATFSEPDAYQAAWLIAQASAIASGYPCFSAETKDVPFAPIVRGVSVGPIIADVMDINPGKEP